MHINPQQTTTSIQTFLPGGEYSQNIIILVGHRPSQPGKITKCTFLYPTILTKVDLDRAFWQIPLTEESKKYTAFTTPYGYFVCNRLLMGLSTYKVIAGMDPFEIMCYIDDLLIVSPNIEAHVKTLDKILTQLSRAGLKLKPAKCEVGRKEVPYLSFVVSSDGVRISDNKVKIVIELPAPRNWKELRRALGMMNYLRMFIPKYSQLAKPLYNLLQQTSEYTWGPEQHKS